MLVLYLTLAVTVMVQEEAAPIAGALAARHGHGNLWLVIMACGVGTWIGDLALYGIGRRTSRLVERPQFRTALAFIRRHPRAAPLAVRFAYGLRFSLPVTCGASRLPWATYVPWVGLSAGLWAGAFGLLGWGAGAAALRLFHETTHYELRLIGVVLLMWLIVFVVFHMRGRHRHVDERDAAGA